MSPIVWNPDPVIFTLFDTFSLRYYSLLFASGLLLGYIVVRQFYIQENRSLKDLDNLAFYVFVGTILGARLGHCLFYEPEYYLSRPLEMILPIQFGEDGFKFVGYQGLASHGGAIGVLLAIILYVRKSKEDIWHILDKMAVAVPLTGTFIRLGNFFNSEILGVPTNGNYGVIFKKVDMVPRHPAQLYEALAYILLFVFLLILYKRKTFHDRKGFLFGLFLTLLFTARLLIEFFKIDQVDFEANMTMNMGQILSIPLILGGIAIMIWKRKKQ